MDNDQRLIIRKANKMHLIQGWIYLIVSTVFLGLAYYLKQLPKSEWDGMGFLFLFVIFLVVGLVFFGGFFVKLGMYKSKRFETLLSKEIPWWQFLLGCLFIPVLIYLFW